MKFYVLLAVVSLIVGPMTYALPAKAGVTNNSVLIHETVLSRCGNHQVAFSGVASYGQGKQQLLVDLDGVPVLNSFAKPLNWTVLVNVTTGYHVLTARVHDPDISKTVDYALVLNIASCENNDGEGEGSTGGSEGPGDETDCCIGPDPIVEQPKTPVPQVKGATTTLKGALNRLTPLNSVFRSVFDRTPTFTEWQYWADRFMNDKPVWDAILGAMQWHDLHGRTVGQ